MLLGRVIGTVWATAKDDLVANFKFQIVAGIDLEGKPLGSFVVAVDAVGAGIGEVVLVVQGSSARQTRQTHNRPVDAVIMAIVDNLEVVDEKFLRAEYDKRRSRMEKRIAELQET